MTIEVVRPFCKLKLKIRNINNNVLLKQNRLIRGQMFLMGLITEKL